MVAIDFEISILSSPEGHFFAQIVDLIGGTSLHHFSKYSDFAFNIIALSGIDSSLVSSIIAQHYQIKN